MVSLRRTALFGESGSGKSTFRDFVIDEAIRLGLSVHVIKLATPLYDIQEFAYRRLNLSISENRQDGILLSFLAQHFRTLRPDVLKSPFVDGLNALRDIDTHHLVLCDDARPADAEFLTDLKFTFVRISTKEDVRRQRIEQRGDATIPETDPNDIGLEGVKFDRVIDNNGDLDRLRESAVLFLGSVVQ